MIEPSGDGFEQLAALLFPSGQPAGDGPGRAREKLRAGVTAVKRFEHRQSLAGGIDHPQAYRQRGPLLAAWKLAKKGGTKPPLPLAGARWLQALNGDSEP